MGAILLAWIMYWVDGLISNEMLASSRLVLAGTPSELRTSLLSIATTTLATAGVVLMMGTFGSLILLVQHISTMLQAPNIAAAAGAELRDVVKTETPGEVNRNGQTGQQATEALVATDGYLVRVRDSGYIQFVDRDTILALARDKDLVFRLLHKPGHFVKHDTAVALVWPASRVDEELDQQIRRAFQIGNVRTPTQDAAYAVNQLVKMGVRAMSPAINDPYTAITCLDYLGEGFAFFVRQGEKSSLFYDQDGRLRLFLEPVTFAELLSGAFDMLRHARCDNASILQQMLKVIDAVSQGMKTPETRLELLRHVCLVRAESQASRLIEDDRQLLRHSCDTLQLKLEQTS